MTQPQSDTGSGRSEQPIAHSQSGDTHPIGLLPPTFDADYVAGAVAPFLLSGRQPATCGFETRRLRKPSATASPPAAPTPQPTAPANSPAMTTPASTQLSESTPAANPLSFDKTTLTAAAGAQVTLTYTNNSNVDHNWHLFDGADPSAPSIVQTPVQSEPGEVETVQFNAPAQPGSYFFRCDVHPTIMTGHLVVGGTP